MSSSLPARPTWRAFALRLSVVLSVTFLGSMAMAQQEERVLLELEVKIPLGTVRGRIDHLAVDPVRKRVIAELANNSLGIVDLNSARLLKRIAERAPGGRIRSANRHGVRCQWRRWHGAVVSR